MNIPRMSFKLSEDAYSKWKTILKSYIIADQIDEVEEELEIAKNNYKTLDQQRKKDIKTLQSKIDELQKKVNRLTKENQATSQNPSSDKISAQMTPLGIPKIPDNFEDSSVSEVTELKRHSISPKKSGFSKPDYTIERTNSNSQGRARSRTRVDPDFQIFEGKLDSSESQKSPLEEKPKIKVTKLNKVEEESPVALRDHNSGLKGSLSSVYNSNDMNTSGLAGPEKSLQGVES